MQTFALPRGKESGRDVLVIVSGLLKDPERNGACPAPVLQTSSASVALHNDVLSRLFELR